MKYSYGDVLNKLRGYGELERRKKQLAYELKHYKEIVTDEDVIEALNYKKGTGERVSGVQPGNITADVAAVYREKAIGIKLQNKREIQEELEQLKAEIRRITYYVGLLDKKQANAVRIHYLKGNSLYQTAEMIGISVATVKRMLKTAVTKLTDMYNLVKS